MSGIRSDFDSSRLFFLTTTAAQRKHLFRRDIIKNMLTDSLCYMQTQKYIHNNPCQPQWLLVQRPEEYAWSSARYYLLGIPPNIPVYDVRELWV